MAFLCWLLVNYVLHATLYYFCAVLRTAQVWLAAFIRIATNFRNPTNKVFWSWVPAANHVYGFSMVLWDQQCWNCERPMEVLLASHHLRSIIFASFHHLPILSKIWSSHYRKYQRNFDLLSIPQGVLHEVYEDSRVSDRTPSFVGTKRNDTRMQTRRHLNRMCEWLPHTKTHYGLTFFSSPASRI